MERRCGGHVLKVVLSQRTKFMQNQVVQKQWYRWYGIYWCKDWSFLSTFTDNTIPDREVK